MAIGNEARPESSHLGKSFRFRGDISGSEDIFIDGEVEGSIQLPGQLVTVGPHGKVGADIQARDIVVHGKLEGNAKAHDRIEVSRTGSVLGDLSMTRISIQDGAFMQGRVDIRLATAPGAANAAAASVSAAVPVPQPTLPGPAASAQTSFLKP